MKTFIVDQKNPSGLVTSVHVEADDWAGAEVLAEAMLTPESPLLGVAVVGELVAEIDA